MNGGIWVPRMGGLCRAKNGLVQRNSMRSYHSSMTEVMNVERKVLFDKLCYGCRSQGPAAEFV